MFNKIDIENWERKKVYDIYIKRPKIICLTVKLDVTKLYRKVKKKKIRFYPCMLYAITKTVNRSPHFKMKKEENGDIGYVDIFSPCYSVLFKGSDLSTAIVTEYKEDFRQFYADFLADQERYKDFRVYDYFNKVENKPPNFGITCVPMLDFTELLSMDPSADALSQMSPSFIIGKYTKKFFKITLPFGMRINHIAADGYHISIFLQNLQKEINCLAKEI